MSITNYTIPPRYTGGNMKNEQMETIRQYVHSTLSRSFAIETPLGQEAGTDYGSLNAQYVNSQVVRNAYIGKEITQIEACMVKCVADATGYSYATVFNCMVMQCEMHYKWNPANTVHGNLKSYVPSRQLLERVVRALSARNNLSVCHCGPQDLFKLYNSVYKVVNLANWTVRNAVTELLNADIDNVHMHSSMMEASCLTHMATRLGIDIPSARDKMRQSGVTAMDILRYARYVAAVRGHRQKILRVVNEAAKGNGSNMRDRLDKAMWDISACAPKNWDRCLSGLPKMIANRKFPAGSIVAIELEFGCRDGSELQGLDDNDYPNIPFVQWKGDGSVGSANGDGMCTAQYQEVNIMFNPNDPAGWASVEKCVDFLKDKGAMVNQTCGMHIHIDTRDLTDRAYQRRVSRFVNAYRNWAKYVVSHSRAHGHYCSVTANPRQRYCAINSCCRAEHRTLEVRIGHGTLNIHKIKAWVAFNRWLMSAKTSETTSFDKFMQSDCPALVKAFIMGRMFRFADTWSNNGDNTPKTIKQSVESTSDTWAV